MRYCPVLARAQLPDLEDCARDRNGVEGKQRLRYFNGVIYEWRYRWQTKDAERRRMLE